MTPEWEMCGPWFQDALEQAGNTHTLDDVWRAVVNGEAFFWFSKPGQPPAGAVSEFKYYPQMKLHNIWLAGGDQGELEKIEDGIADFARLNGCARLIAVGRRGWGRRMDMRGFTARHQLYTKDLT